MKTLPIALLSAIATLVASSAPAIARCAKGFTGMDGYNYCVPENAKDRKVWLDCTDEPNRLGLTAVSPCISETSRIKLIDNYVFYCQKSKLPHLYQ